jgi:hypothetical protein
LFHLGRKKKRKNERERERERDPTLPAAPWISAPKKTG